MLDLQRLEQRRLLSATVTYQAGQLIVQGDKNNDDLLVTVVGGRIEHAVAQTPEAFNGARLLSTPVVSVFDHGKQVFTSATFPRQSIGHVELLGSAGDDALAVKVDNAYMGITVDGQWGQDQISFQANSATGKLQVLGGDDADLITGTTIASGNVIFDAGAGNDVVNLSVAGMAGHTVLGGEGDDVLTLSAKVDSAGARVLGYTAYGEAGNDFIRGSALADSLYGGDGDNEIHAGAGNDWVCGGSGSDFLYGDEGDDFLDHGGGFDMIDGGAGFDKAMAGADDKVVDVEQLLLPL